MPSSTDHAVEHAIAENLKSGTMKSWIVQAVIQWGGFALIGWLYYHMTTSEMPAIRASHERVLEGIRQSDEKRIEKLVTAIDKMGQRVEAVILTNSQAMENLGKEVKLSREARATKPNGGM